MTTSNFTGNLNIDHTVNVANVGVTTHQNIDNHISSGTQHGVSSQIVGINDIQTLQNKTIDGNNNTITNIPASSVNGILPVVKGGTGLSSIPSNGVLIGNNTSTPNIQVINGIVVDSNSSQTVFNKTLTGCNLTACNISSLDNIVSATNLRTSTASVIFSNATQPNPLDIIYAVDSFNGAWTSTASLGILTTTNLAEVSNKIIDGSSNTLTNINLTSAATGTLPVANGGTGSSSLASGNFIQGNGTNPFTATKVVPSGAVLGTTDLQNVSNKNLDNSNQINAWRLRTNDFNTNVEVVGSAPPSVGQVLTATASNAANWQTPASGGGDVTLNGVQTLTNKTIVHPTNDVSANLLRTNAGNINIGTASNPSAGQVLTATSAIAAQWQTPAGTNAIITNGQDQDAMIYQLSTNTLVNTPEYGFWIMNSAAPLIPTAAGQLRIDQANKRLYFSYFPQNNSTLTDFGDWFLGSASQLPNQVPDRNILFFMCAPTNKRLTYTRSVWFRMKQGSGQYFPFATPIYAIVTFEDSNYTDFGSDVLTTFTKWTVNSNLVIQQKAIYREVGQLNDVQLGSLGNNNVLAYDTAIQKWFNREAPTRTLYINSDLDLGNGIIIASNLFPIAVNVLSTFNGFFNVNYNNGNMLDMPSGVYTAPETGIYIFSASVTIETPVAINQISFFWRNNSSTIIYRGIELNPVPDSNTVSNRLTYSFSRQILLTIGDEVYFEMSADNSIGGGGLVIPEMSVNCTFINKEVQS